MRSGRTKNKIFHNLKVFVFLKFYKRLFVMFSMEMMYIVLIVAGAILLLGLIMFIISKMKGGIKIELTNFNFSAGDTIEGKVILNLKKPVNAKTLNVGLVGEMKSTSYGSGH